MLNELKIDAKRKYELSEILKGNIIPGVETYHMLYNLVTVKKEKKRESVSETTKYNIQSIAISNPWSKTIRKIVVEGNEIIKFLKLNKLL